MAEFALKLKPLPLVYWVVEDNPSPLRRTWPLHLLPDETIKDLLKEFEDSVWQNIHHSRVNPSDANRHLCIRPVALPPSDPTLKEPGEPAYSPNDYQTIF